MRGDDVQYTVGSSTMLSENSLCLSVCSLSLWLSYKYIFPALISHIQSTSVGVEPTLGVMSASPNSPKNYSKHPSSAGDSGAVSSLPYHGIHPYSWNLERHNPYQHYYYNNHPYYRNWFNSYKEQWSQKWHKFKGTSLFKKLPYCKLF